MQIDDGLAQAIASQVAVGLTPGDDAELRARGALMAIGLMVTNADRENGRVREILGTPERGTIKRLKSGALQITVAYPELESEPAPEA
jgi:hypothetical protein